MTDIAPLFRPFTLRGMTLPNRIVMAPMTRSRSPGGFPNEHNVAYYARRATNDVGLILSEGTLVRRKGASGDANIPLFWGELGQQRGRQVVRVLQMNARKTGNSLDAFVRKSA